MGPLPGDDKFFFHTGRCCATNRQKYATRIFLLTPLEVQKIDVLQGCKTMMLRGKLETLVARFVKPLHTDPFPALVDTRA